MCEPSLLKQSQYLVVLSRHEYVLCDSIMHDPFGLFYIAVGDRAGAVAETEGIRDALDAVSVEGTQPYSVGRGIPKSRSPDVYFPYTPV